MSSFWDKYGRREEIGRMIWVIYAVIAVILFLILNHFNSARRDDELSQRQGAQRSK